jgi:hypothetical protein
MISFEVFRGYGIIWATGIPEPVPIPSLLTPPIELLFLVDVESGRPNFN